MRAAFIQRFGPPEVLQIGELPLPSVGNRQVLVRVRATSVNPVDCYMRAGGLRRFSRIPFPIVPGIDVAGIVETCGKDVGEFHPGQEVFGFLPMHRNATAEFVACNPSWLALKPSILAYEEAAVLPCVGLTALQALRDKAQLGPGQTVMIVGASGGVGTAAVQIGAAMQLKVTGVCGSRNVSLVRALGAECVIDYTKESPLENRGRFDAVFDCVGGWDFWDCWHLLKPAGRHVGISCTRLKKVVGLLTRATPGRKSFQFHVAPSRKDLDQLSSWVVAGKLKPVITHRFSLSEIAAAHQQCESRRTVGKIAVTIS